MQSPIKWSGSKRSQASTIVSLMPREIDTYYEPFCGGGSVFIELAQSDIKVNRFVISDLNDDLISLWKVIITDSKGIYRHYKEHWLEMKSIPNWDKKKRYYVSVRDRFNKNRSPYDFMFIMRTTFNGMSRYNKKGEFNSPLHPRRDGIIPERLLCVMDEFKKIIDRRNVEFLNCSYDTIESDKHDVLYLDPPYLKTTGMYYGILDNYNDLWDFLRKQKGKWLLSFDGKTTSHDYKVGIPKDLYKTHQYLNSGNSSLRRLNGKSNKEYVFESLYTNYT
jgi:DNA adenine methylase